MSVAVRSVVADFSAVDIDARLEVSDPDGGLVAGESVSLRDAAGNTCEGRVASASADGTSGSVELDLTSWVSA